MYRMLRVFCATAWELEGERRAFYDLLGGVNEKLAMQQDVLYVPVSLTNTPDKRPYQYTVDENIRACRHYILAVDEDWGPKERNFERDYRLALKCREDASLPMSQVAILVRNLPDGSAPAFVETLRTAGFESALFSTPEEFVELVRAMLASWLPADAVGEQTHTAQV